MAQQLDRMLSVLGLITWGDLGPLTLYRNKRGRIVSYLKAPPTCPPSPAQKYHRDKWRAAATAWKELDAEAHARWELASHRASLAITGYNLWVYYHTTSDVDAIRSIEAITHLDLLGP